MKRCRCRCRCRCISIVIFLMFVSSIHAQNFLFQYLGIEEGLKSNKVFMTIEDSDGFIWIATENGVSRYDGSNVKSYSLGKIQGTYVTLHLDIDSNGVVWLVLSNGSVYNYDVGLDEFVFFDQILSENKNNFYVNEFHIDHENQFLVGAPNYAFIYDTNTKITKQIPEIKSTVNSIIQSSDHKYFIGCREGVFVYNEKLEFLFNLKEKEIEKNWLPKNQRILSMCLQETEDKLWLGSENSGLFFYDLKHQQLSSSDPLLGQLKLEIRSIVDAGSGKLMIGTDGGGVFIFDTFNAKIIEQLGNEKNRETSLSSKAIHDISISSQGVVFISTYRGGVNIFNPKRQNFFTYKDLKGESNSLQNNIIYSIAEPRSGVLSFGTDSGISFFEKSTRIWKHLSLDPTGKQNKSEVAWSQTIDNQGNIWVSSFIYALSKFEKNGNDYLLQTENPLIPSGVKIKNIYTHTNGDVLLGSIHSGLFLVNASGQLKNFPIQKPIDFEPYSFEKVLIACSKGIAILDLKYDEVNFLNDGLIGETLNGKAVVSLLIDKDRNLVVGTSANGVFVFDAEFKTVRALNTTTGLASNNIFDLVNDSEGNIWISTALGLSKIEGEIISNFYKSDGLISTDFNRNTAFLDEEGILYFGTNQGPIFFDPKTIEPSKIKKKLLLTDFYLNHERIVSGENSILTQPLNQTESLELNYDQNSFSIGFTNIDFIHPEEGEYTWKLEGFDPKWVREKNQAKAIYANLNPGDYVFKLKLINQRGELLAPERQISLTISPSFWKSNWAYLFYALLVLSLIGLLYYLNKIRTESQSAQERLHLLMEMAHEIKTPLTLIRAPIVDLLNNKKTGKQAEESLNVALKSADKLHQQMMQFLDFKKVDIRKNSLQIEIVDLVKLIKSKLFAFKPLSDKKAIELIFEPTQTEFFIKTDEKILDKIISNLISNAIKYTLKNGTVKLTLESFQDQWTLSIKDNGIGILKEDQKKIFTLFFRADNAKASESTGSGVGLVLASDLAKTLDGIVKLVNSNDYGSEFLITMPMPESIDAIDLINEKSTAQIETQIPEKEVLNNNKIKILIVEDDDDLRNYQRLKFENKYQIQTAANGEEALLCVANNPPDLIISDVVMPKMNGRQLCMNIKSNIATSHILFILLTGQESREYVQQGFESGADDYIFKPFDFDILSSKIDNLLHTQKASREKFSSSEAEVEYQDLTNELDQKFLDTVTNLVNDNISDPELSVNFLCQSMGMSRSSFYNKLKSLVDLSPSEFIRTIRLREAKKMLMNPNMNISEVAYSTGFSDAKYFSTRFKKYFNQSPSQYIAAQKKVRR